MRKCLVALTLLFSCINTSFALQGLGKCLRVVFLLLCCCGSVLYAAPVTTEQATSVVAGWRKTIAQPLATQLGTEPQTVEIFSDEHGKSLYYVVYLAPSGFVVVPADDRIEPVICFAAAGRYDPGMDNPLGALVSQDIKDRVAAIAAAATDSTDIGTNADADTTQQAQEKWQYLSRFSGSDDFDDFSGYTGRNDSIDSADFIDSTDQEPIPYASFSSISDVCVDPLIQSRWSQSTECSGYCYNYYTPSHYVCGCVATAMAQVLRFHEYPVEGIGVIGFTISVNGVSQTAYTRGGNGSGGPYLWDEMMLDPDCTITDVQRRAIGALCYDAGVSVNMMYSSGCSGAYSLGDAALKNTFGYSNAINGNNSDNNIGAGLNGMINPNLDCGYPVILGITGNGGHAIVTDGYGYDSATLYHHLNLGWAGSYDAWYNLPSVLSFNAVRGCIYNIYVSGTGEIISGRVTTESGTPIANVQITAQRSGGGSYQAATNARGIYAMGKVPSASTFTISAVKTGYNFSDQMVTTGTSADDHNTAGNRWAINFVDVRTLPGSGTPQDPYLIQSLEDFMLLAHNSSYWNDCIRLESDIDLSGQTFTTAVISPDDDPDAQYLQGTPFTGNFDGNGYKITGLNIDASGTNHSFLGLFGQIETTAVIQNLGVENVSITAGGNTQLLGCLVGYTHTGGSVISNCYATGSITAGTNVIYMGGLTGANNGHINDCYAMTNITGGTNCDYLGGLVGRNCPAAPGDIDNCYSTGAVSAGADSSDVGGLSGNNAGSVTDSFWDMDTSGQTTSGGGEGKTTTQMQDINIFLAANWDFVNIWKMPVGGGYPKLYYWQNPYDGGLGTSESPYQIRTTQQLLNLANNSGDYNKYFILTADINLSGLLFTAAPIAPDTDPSVQYFQGTDFTGSFDGDGHKITGLTIGASGTNHCFLGLFGRVVSPGVIKNLSVENVSITTGDNTQLLGCLAGYNRTGTVSNCYADGSVSAGANVIYMGGLTGANNGYIDNCYARASVTGGINCNNLGGLCGSNAPISPGYIDNCYSTGSVIAGAGSDYLGGLVGNNACSVTDSFWDTDTSGMTTSDGGEGKTTVQMQDINTFLAANWDFVNIWKMSVSNGYPILFWQQDNTDLYDGGLGTQQSPYQIRTTWQLLNLANHTEDYGKYFILTADIDLSGRTFSTALIAPDTDSSAGSFQGTAFTGSFNGNGHTISNLNISNGAHYLGLFGYIENGSVTNLGMENVAISGADHCYIGGLCGYNVGTITDCYLTGTVTGNRFVGGLCGENYCSITNCYSAGSVTGHEAVGGLCGQNSQNGSFTSCYSTGSVAGSGDDSDSVGGLCGCNYGGITSCYSTGYVTGSSFVGGLLGYLSSGTVTGCFWDMDTSGQTTSSGGTGKTTAQMQDINTFLAAGWDFDDTWKIFYGPVGYPLLSWQDSDDDGTAEKPYQIGTASQLLYLANHTADYGKHFILIADIDLSGRTFATALIAPDAYNSAQDFQAIPLADTFNIALDPNTAEDSDGTADYNTNDSWSGIAFTGTFNGSSHAISNLTIDDAGAGNGYLGLFGRISNGSVTNLSLENVDISGTGDHVGALCGMKNNGNITNCNFTGEVNGGYEYVGGLCGLNYGSITGCYFSGTVHGGWAVGGLCGWSHEGNITNGYSTGTVIGYGRLGGLCGVNYGNITNCYSTGTVIGTHDRIGGLCGDNGGSINKSFWDINTSCQTTSSGGTGKTTAQMQDINTFLSAGWNFVNIWKMPNIGGYPLLTWQDDIDRYDDGMGTQQAPYQIRTTQQLLNLANYPGDYNKYFILTADIDLSGQTFTTALIAPDNDPSAQYLQGAPFTGTFDGNGHKITNLTIDASGTNHSFLGLFGQLNTPGLIKNLGVENVSITTGNDTRLLGALAGYTHIGGVISNCYSTGSITAGTNVIYMGGLTGANNGHISDCYAMTTVSGGTNSDYLGGLTGYNAPAAPGFIENCYSTGTVTGTNHVGGLVGDNNTGTVDNSFWDTDTSGLTTSDGGEGKTTVQMQDINTFLAANWDFENLWHMPYQSTGYPMLFWQRDIPGDFTAGYGVTLVDFAIFSQSWLTSSGQPDYNEDCDLVDDDTINLADLVLFAENFLQGI